MSPLSPTATYWGLPLPQPCRTAPLRVLVRSRSRQVFFQRALPQGLLQKPFAQPLPPKTPTSSGSSTQLSVSELLVQFRPSPLLVASGKSKLPLTTCHLLRALPPPSGIFLLSVVQGSSLNQKPGCDSPGQTDDRIDRSVNFNFPSFSNFLRISKNTRYRRFSDHLWCRPGGGKKRHIL